MTLYPMSRGDYFVHRARKPGSSNILDVQAAPYRSEELARYLDQTQAIKRSYSAQKSAEEKKQFFAHLDKQIAQTIEKALDELFKDWNK